MDGASEGRDERWEGFAGLGPEPERGGVSDQKAWHGKRRARVGGVELPKREHEAAHEDGSDPITMIEFHSRAR